MTTPLRTPSTVGYCTNVHPGRDLDEVRGHLETISLEVKNRVRPDSEMGLGLWLSDRASRALSNSQELNAFRQWLAQHDLVPFTFNGFPFFDFHQAVVKHRVYRPDWSDPRRLDYTVRLARLLGELNRGRPTQDSPLTVSTVPLGWPGPETDESFLRACAKNLLLCAQALADLSDSHGARMLVCLEPEPGCVLDTAEDVVRFMQQYLRNEDPATRQRVDTHIGVCHDICHSSVMFESQSHALKHYREYDIAIGKVQVSNALSMELLPIQSREQRRSLREALRSFAEPRYLHQTCVRRLEGQVEFFEDLSLANERLALDDVGPSGFDVPLECRVHFHLPLFCREILGLDTTQDAIVECLQTIVDESIPVRQFELETYAWGVIPEWNQRPLVDGLAEEFAWFDRCWRDVCADFSGD